MLRFAAYLLVIISLLAGWAAPASAEKRVALVIGNSAYAHAPVLINPKNDAAAMSAMLTKLGFDVVTGIDLTQRDFARTVGQFRQKLIGAEVGLFFYAGHGLQVHGQNFLAPVDAVLDNETSLDFEAVQLRVILKLLERSTKTNLVFLDACRDNPLSRNLARSMGTRSTAIGNGLARVESGLGTLIAFATQPGNVALDGTGKNSPFATGMLKHMQTPGLDVALVMRRVREEVIKSTSGSQVPWTNSSLTGSFIFNEKPKEVAKPVAEKPVLQGVDPLAVELAFWQAAKDAGTRQAFDAYLKKYPKGTFAPMVAIILAELTQAEAAEAAEVKHRAALETAQKKQEAAEKSRRMAVEKQKKVRQAEARKRTEEVVARLKAEAVQRQRELAELETMQAEERTRLAKDRNELIRRLKAMELTAKTRAEENKEKEQKMAALQPREQQPETYVLATPLLDPHTMTLVLQNELKRVGCDPGVVDGKWGGKGSAALTRFNLHAKLKLPTDTPTMETLETVKGASERVCPLVCGPQFNMEDDQCVKKTCRSGQWLNTRGQCVKYVVKRKKKSGTRKKSTSSKSTSSKSTKEKSSGGTGFSISGGGIGLRF